MHSSQKYDGFQMSLNRTVCRHQQTDQILQSLLFFSLLSLHKKSIPCSNKKKNSQLADYQVSHFMQKREKKSIYKKTSTFLTTGKVLVWIIGADNYRFASLNSFSICNRWTFMVAVLGISS